MSRKAKCVQCRKTSYNKCICADNDAYRTKTANNAPESRRISILSNTYFVGNNDSYPLDSELASATRHTRTQKKQFKPERR